MKTLKNTLTIGLLAVTTLLSYQPQAKAGLGSYSHDKNFDIRITVPNDNDVVKTTGLATKLYLPSQKFDFLIWNLHKGSNNSFRYEYVTLAIKRDIILVQEMYLDRNMLDTFRLFPLMLHTTATSFFTGSENIRTGVANISAVKPTFTKFIRTENREPVIRSPKMTLITSYPIKDSNKKLTVVNIHGINFVTDKSFREELSRIYEVIKNIPSPLVFSGDFNTWNSNRLKILAEYTQKLGMKEATFSPDERLKFNGNPLDHFLYTPDLKILSAKVDGDHDGSDHKPLEVEVEYSPLKDQKEIDSSYQDLLATY